MDIQTKLKNYYNLPNLPESSREVSLHNNYLCSENIKNSFKYLTHSIQYTTTIYGQPIKISFFYTDSTDKCLERFKHMIVVLLLLQPKHSMEIDMLFSPIKKILPKTGIIGPENINTGYSTGNRIVVYREEEWLKVFIHECFHNLDLDEELESSQLNDKILKMFPVNSEVNIRESYCETWARILNCYMISVYHNLPLKQLLITEQNFSRHQMSKILNYMNLSYLQIQAPHSSYREDTNILAYIILGDILMNSPFIKWCKHNNSVFKINKSAALKYVQFIKSNIPKNIVYHHTNNSTKMTINSIDI